MIFAMIFKTSASRNSGFLGHLLNNPLLKSSCEVFKLYNKRIIVFCLCYASFISVLFCREREKYLPLKKQTTETETDNRSIKGKDFDREHSVIVQEKLEFPNADAANIIVNMR